MYFISLNIESEDLFMRDIFTERDRETEYMRVLVKRLCIENGLKYSHFAPMAGIKTRSFGN